MKIFTSPVNKREYPYLAIWTGGETLDDKVDPDTIVKIYVLQKKLGKIR